MRFFLLSFFVLAIFVGASHSAKADYFVWQDPATGLSLSWPDTWKRVSNADADDIITIMAPSGRAHASCRVRVRDDGRFAIYPPRLSWAVQQIAYSGDFWNGYLAEYDDHSIDIVKDGAGLGRGFASYALADYESAVQGPYMKRRGLMFASLYNNKAYILECSSHRDAFASFKGIFLSIAGSVDFKKAHHELMSGHYRDFMADGRLIFKGDEGENRVVY